MGSQMPCRSADISHSSPSGCQHTVCLSRTPREGPGHGHLAIGLPSFQPDRRWCTVAPHNPPARSSNYRPHPQLELLSPCARAKSCWFFRSTKNLAVAVNETYYLVLLISRLLRSRKQRAHNRTQRNPPQKHTRNAHTTVCTRTLWGVPVPQGPSRSRGSRCKLTDGAVIPTRYPTLTDATRIHEPRRAVHGGRVTLEVEQTDSRTWTGRTKHRKRETHQTPDTHFG